MTREQSSRCHDIVVLYNGNTYLVKSARIEPLPTYWRPGQGFTPMVPQEITPRDKRDAEVYRVEDDGLQMFACWLEEAPASFRAAYARRFLQEISGGRLTAIPGSLANHDKIFAYAR